MRRFFRPVPLLLFAITALLLYSLAGFFLVPHIIKAHVLPAVADQLHRPVMAKEIAFNPFVLSLKMTEFEIQEQDGAPLIGFQEFFINFQTVSLLHRAYVFKEIRFALPFVSIKVAKDGHVNLTDLLPPEEAAASSLPPEDSHSPKGLPAIQIEHFEIAQGIVEFQDASKPQAVSIDVVPINLMLNNFYTKQGGDNRYAFTAELDKDEILDWKGTLSLEPIASEGTLSLSGVKIATLFQYVQDQFHFDIPTGTIRAIGRYRFTAGPPLDLQVSDTLLHFTDIGIVERGDSVPVIALHTLFLDGIHADLRQRRLEIESITLDKGAHRIWRNADGSLNLPALLMPVQAQPVEEPATNVVAPPTPSRAPAWTLAIKDASITHHNIEFEDRALDFPARLKVSDLTVRTHEVVFPFKKPIPLTVKHRLNETGSVTVEGDIGVQPLQADLTVSLKDIPVQPFEPYVEQFARIAVDTGALDLDGTLQFAAEHPKGPLMAFKGNLGVKALAVADRDDGAPVASWKQVQLREIAIALDPTSVTIEEIGIHQPTVHLAIDSDGVPNIKKLLSGAKSQNDPMGTERSSQHTKNTPSPSISVKTVKVLKGTATFRDESIAPPVQAGLHDLTGTVKGLSSKQMARAEVNLSGKIDKVAPLKVAGTINPLTEDTFTDLTIRFDNVDLTTAAPYTGKYVGYPIRKGKLFLDLVYKVSQKQLEAENKVAVDQLTFGEKTDSPDATSLPVPLAIALLKDRQGRIDIDLPIRGDLKDPDFRYGKAVWATLGNLLTKMVASPFALMGKLVPGGGDGEELQHLAFQPGSTTLDPKEQKKIDALMKGMEERPGLRLEITGTADPARDREALALQRLEEQLRARWRNKSGDAKNGDKPSPTDEERLIRELYDHRRSQQPPAPQKAEPPTVEEMKRELLATMNVEEDALRTLARTRAEQVHEQLVGEGKLSDERVFLTDVDLAPSEDHEKVQSRLNITAGS
jgi:uncharacterized protein involved in outer membrane biogenesis